MTSEIDKVLAVVTRQLPEAGVDVIMIGGHAVNAYGVTRATQDIDFMVATSKESVVRDIMQKAGFSNIASHETVLFMSQPGSSLRVDFLKVSQETLDQLLENSQEIDFGEECRVRIPQLRDLLAMKVFALASGVAEREEKDFADIVNLAIENKLDPDSDLREICREYGTTDIYARIEERIRELGHD